MVAAGQPTDRRALYVAGNFADRFEIADRSNRKSRLDHIDSEINKRIGNLDFLFKVVGSRG